MILYNNTKRYFLLFIFLYSSHLFSMSSYAQVNRLICERFFYTESINNTIDAIEQLNINEENFIDQKDTFKTLLEIFFKELKYPPIKHDLLLFFELDKTLSISRVALNFYYQRDYTLTSFFIDTINNIFDCIEDDQLTEQDKEGLKMGAFLRIASMPQASQHCSVLWNTVTKKAFIYIDNLNIKEIQKKSCWYNTLAKDNNESEGITSEDKQKIYGAYIKKCSKDNLNSLDASYITFTQKIERYPEFIYIYSHENQNHKVTSLISVKIEDLLINRFTPLETNSLPESTNQTKGITPPDNNSPVTQSENPLTNTNTQSKNKFSLCKQYQIPIITLSAVSVSILMYMFLHFLRK